MTALRAVALAYRDSQLFGKLNLELALTWSEKVTQDDRDIIREYLGVEIWDSYSSEELGAIALQCPDNQHLHVLPFFTHVEIIDDQGKPCEIGQPGRVVATSLHIHSR
jgi:phenylacetate-CoA ligase